MASIQGTQNNDTITPSSQSSGVIGGPPTDNADSIYAKNGDDFVFAGGGNDYISGGNGNDRLDGWTGNDTVYGGGGNDTLLGWTGDDILRGDWGNDRIFGEDGNDDLAGQTGSDILNGGNGDDILSGGSGTDGSDTLTGGAGADRFQFFSAIGDVDTITDFTWQQGDKIAVWKSGFGNDLQSGALPGNQFTIGASAQDANDRFIYNSSNGALFFDADGIGGQAQVQFASLSTGLNLIGSDIVVV
ncbi:MAG: calcium-binding protein [Cyanobacteria bacterium P01_A01_bin.114]